MTAAQLFRDLHYLVWTWIVLTVVAAASVIRMFWSGMK